MFRARKSPKRRAARLRDSERTRERLLQAAFREVYKVGFQSAAIDTILAATNVTKGALYYHFENKQALGYAIVEEIVAKLPRDRWLLPLQQSKDKDPIDALIDIVQSIPAQPRDVKGGSLGQAALMGAKAGLIISTFSVPVQEASAKWL